MEIREALRTHSPSLLLQRAAADEIARLDRKLWLLGEQLKTELSAGIARITELESELNALKQETPMSPNLPELAFVDNSWDKSPGAPPVIGIKRGEDGFYPVFTTATADELNASYGVTPAQREAMHNGSMFGWDVPGADPDHPLVQKIANAKEKAL